MLKKWLQGLKCRLGYHPYLDVIQSFGSAQHVGCPYCLREMGIHHGMRAVIPWDAELAEMYEVMGYDVETPRRRWQAYLQAMATPTETPSGR